MVKDKGTYLLVDGMRIPRELIRVGVEKQGEVNTIKSIRNVFPNLPLSEVRDAVHCAVDFDGRPVFALTNWKDD